MGGFVQARTDRAAAHRGAASPTQSSGSADAARTVSNPRAQSLLQMRLALDQSPRVKSQVALQRALDRPARAPAAEKRQDRLPLQIKNATFDPANSVAQRKLILAPGSEQEAGSLRADFAKGSVPSARLITDAESQQIGALAEALGQQQVLYDGKNPLGLQDGTVHFFIGHSGYFEGMDFEKIAQDFKASGLQTGSTIKLITCMGANMAAYSNHINASALASALKKVGLDVVVIATTGMVHATGKGIASYTPVSTDPNFTGENRQVDKAAYAHFQNRRKELEEQAKDLRRQFKTAKDDHERQEIFDEFKVLAAKFYDESIEEFNEARKTAGKGKEKKPGKTNPFATTKEEGWLKFIGEKQGVPVTDEEALLGAPEGAAIG